MGAWSSFSGKFDSRLTERLYDLSLNGGADEEASNEGGQWAGIMRFRRAAVILAVDSQGFVTSDTVPLAEADERWAEVAEAIEPADEPADDKPAYFGDGCQGDWIGYD